MEEIYANVAYDKSVGPRASTNPTGCRSSERRFHGAVVLCLGLLSVFLLAGLIGLSIHLFCISSRRSAAELSSVKANLTEHLQVSYKKLSALTEERDQLNVSLIEMTKERNSLKRRCPAGWMVFSCSCYFVSTESGSWEKGRQDCKERGADLVVIDSAEEQTFVVSTGKTAWIGLTDRDEEGTWKWIDGTPLTLKNWERRSSLIMVVEIHSGGEEDCAHIRPNTEWNDRSCDIHLRWICEKTAQHC
ncbi:CD209 antigen-like protein C [Epinephelus lanceolatus]